MWLLWCCITPNWTNYVALRRYFAAGTAHCCENWENTNGRRKVSLQEQIITKILADLTYSRKTKQNKTKQNVGLLPLLFPVIYCACKQSCGAGARKGRKDKHVLASIDTSRKTRTVTEHVPLTPPGLHEEGTNDFLSSAVSPVETASSAVSPIEAYFTIKKIIRTSENKEGIGVLAVRYNMICTILRFFVSWLSLHSLLFVVWARHKK